MTLSTSISNIILVDWLIHSYSSGHPVRLHRPPEAEPTLRSKLSYLSLSLSSYGTIASSLLLKAIIRGVLLYLLISLVMNRDSTS